MSSKEEENKKTIMKRFIYDDTDLLAFLSSPSKMELLKFISGMGSSCAAAATMEYQYDSNTPLRCLSPGLATLVGALHGMQEWIQEVPPSVSDTIRFGNPAFRIWHQEKLVQRMPGVIRCILKNTKQYNTTTTTTTTTDEDEDYDDEILNQCYEEGKQATTTTTTTTDTSDPDIVTEVCAYFKDAFGHPVRLDYGTGHETCFQIVLLVLYKVGVFGSSSQRRFKAACFSTWDGYLQITRTLQKDYRLEPAGSHGVWGLDDYYCLPFYFGAQQLVQQQDLVLTPSESITSTHKQFLYLDCISFIQDIKKGAPFFETSPMLYDISRSVSDWKKVASGVYKYYEAEVLSKRPVVQHLVFGKYFPANWIPSQTEDNRQAPTTTFRTVPTTRAPWAKGNNKNMPPPTRAPWAKK